MAHLTENVKTSLVNNNNNNEVWVVTSYGVVPARVLYHHESSMRTLVELPDGNLYVYEYTNVFSNQIDALRRAAGIKQLESFKALEKATAYEAQAVKLQDSLRPSPTEDKTNVQK